MPVVKAKATGFQTGSGIANGENIPITILVDIGQPGYSLPDGSFNLVA